MKKRILFIDKNFDMGGIQTSLLNMLDILSDEYDVDLFMYYPEGTLKDRLPHNVRLLPSTWRIVCLGMSLKECLRHGSFRQKLFRIMATIWSKIFDNRLPISIAFSHHPKLQGYDVAIAYHHETEKRTLTSGFCRFADKNVDAKIKMSWIHNDPIDNPIDETFNEKYYSRMDQIVCVSDSIRNRFDSVHPILKGKTTYCYNFLDVDKIKALSAAPIDFEIDCNSFICFSACRLNEIKGIPRAVAAISEVLKKNPDVIWVIAGDGPCREQIESAIADKHLERQILLVGRKLNPYCYMRMANLVLLVSYAEAAPMLYSEAKILGVPVFSTELASTQEMLSYGEYGVICENTEEGIRLAFEDVISNRSKLKSIKEKMGQRIIDSEHYCRIFAELITR